MRPYGRRRRRPGPPPRGAADPQAVSAVAPPGRSPTGSTAASTLDRPEPPRRRPPLVLVAHVLAGGVRRRDDRLARHRRVPRAPGARPGSRPDGRICDLQRPAVAHPALGSLREARLPPPCHRVGGRHASAARGGRRAQLAPDRHRRHGHARGAGGRPGGLLSQRVLQRAPGRDRPTLPVAGRRASPVARPAARPGGLRPAGLRDDRAHATGATPGTATAAGLGATSRSASSSTSCATSGSARAGSPRRSGWRSSWP